MTVRELRALKEQLNSREPPIDQALLNAIIEVEWDANSKVKIGLMSDILIRLGVDVIVCAAELSGSDRDSYCEAFRRLAQKIENSSILSSSTDFQDYFASYKDYLNDFERL